MWDELTILWNDLTILWNDLTIDWNDLTWNDLTMERNDRIPITVTLTYLGIFLKVVILYSTGLVVTQHLSSSGDPMINALQEGMCIFVG